MMPFVPYILLLITSCGLAYVKEIDRLERDQDPSQSGKMFFRIAVSSLVLTFLFTLWSADAGLILLTLSLYLSALLLGIYMGQKLAWLIYRRRNPDLFEEE